MVDEMEREKYFLSFIFKMSSEAPLKNRQLKSLLSVCGCMLGDGNHTIKFWTFWIEILNLKKSKHIYVWEITATTTAPLEKV